MKKVILFDIDETLISNGEYPKNFKEIKEKINNLKRQKIEVGICTYRPFDKNVKKIIRDYGLNGPIIAEGGACVYKKTLIGYNMEVYNFGINKNLNKKIKLILQKYRKSNQVDMHKESNREAIMINKNRKMSSTIYFPESKENQIDSIIELLKNSSEFQNTKILRSNNNKLKVTVFPKYINKIATIEKCLKNTDVTFVTDYEEIIPMHSKLIKIFSVGTNVKFNKYCDNTFSVFGNGVEEILRKMEEEYARI